MNKTKSNEDLARDYHVASRNLGAFKKVANAHRRNYAPKIQKLVAEAPLRLSDVHRIALPLPSKITMPIGDALIQRTSTRQFKSTNMSLPEVSTLLYHANGVRAIHGEGAMKNYQRNVPNSGNLGSVETYLIVSNVTGLEPGVFHFDSVTHELALIRGGRFSSFLHEYVFFQHEFSQAPLVMVLAASIGRLSKKYALRGYRLALLDVGHVSQNIYLAATAMNLRVCATAGFIDDEMDETLRIDGIESATMLAIAVGSGAHGT